MRLALFLLLLHAHASRVLVAQETPDLAAPAHGVVLAPGIFYSAYPQPTEQIRRRLKVDLLPRLIELRDSTRSGTYGTVLKMLAEPEVLRAKERYEASSQKRVSQSDFLQKWELELKDKRVDPYGVLWDSLLGLRSIPNLAIIVTPWEGANGPLLAASWVAPRSSDDSFPIVVAYCLFRKVNSEYRLVHDPIEETIPSPFLDTSR